MSAPAYRIRDGPRAAVTSRGARVLHAADASRRPRRGQPHRRRRGQRRRGPGRRRVQPPHRAGRRVAWDDVSCAAFLERGARASPRAWSRPGSSPVTGWRLMSRTRYEWTLLDYAIWFAGAVGVPVYETSSAEQVRWILADSGARASSSRGPEHQRPGRRGPWRPRGAAPRLVPGRQRRRRADPPRRRRRRRELEAAPHVAGAGGPRHADLHLRHHRSPQGLHAHPRQPHDRAVVAVEELDDAVRDGDDDAPASTLLFLPLAHVFARDHPGRLRAHRAPAWATAPTSPTWSPTCRSSARRSSWRCRGSSRRSSTPPPSAPPPTAAAPSSTGPPSPPSPTRAGLDRGRPDAAGARPSTPSSPGWSTPGCARALGGRCRYAVSGGAPLGERLSHFYRGIGLTILEGYGLTETTAAVTVNLPEALKIGTVGRPLPGTAVRVADDGELLFRGGQVFRGYWNAPEATAEALGRRRLAPHRRRRRGRRRGLRADHRAQEGDPGDRGRQERRARRPRGPAARPPAGQPVPRRRRRPALHRGPGHHRRGRLPRLARAQHGASRHRGRPRRRPRPARRGRRPPSTRPTRRSPRPSRSASSASSPTTGPRRPGSSPPASSCAAPW